MMEEAIIVERVQRYEMSWRGGETEDRMKLVEGKVRRR